MTSDLAQLVDDVLYRRFLEVRGSIAFDPALDELLERSGDPMPAIEELIRREVLDVCPWDHPTRRDLFPGLEGIFRAYFESALRLERVAAAAEFVWQLYGGTLVVALDVMAWTGERREPLPGPWLHVSQRIARYGKTAERAAAEALLAARAVSVAR